MISKTKGKTDGVSSFDPTVDAAKVVIRTLIDMVKKDDSGWVFNDKNVDFIQKTLTEVSKSTQIKNDFRKFQTNMLDYRKFFRDFYGDLRGKKDESWEVFSIPVENKNRNFSCEVSLTFKVVKDDFINERGDLVVLVKPIVNFAFGACNINTDPNKKRDSGSLFDELIQFIGALQKLKVCVDQLTKNETFYTVVLKSKKVLVKEKEVSELFASNNASKGVAEIFNKLSIAERKELRQLLNKSNKGLLQSGQEESLLHGHPSLRSIVWV